MCERDSSRTKPNALLVSIGTVQEIVANVSSSY